MNLSVVIPIYNEEAGLAALFARLYPALDALGLAYEIIFVNDGSRDRSAALLREQFGRRPDVTLEDPAAVSQLWSSAAAAAIVGRGAAPRSACHPATGPTIA